MPGNCTNLKDVNELQENIMSLVSWWVKEKKTLVPRSMIVAEMVDRGIKDFTTISALNTLLRKGYIRRCSRHTNKTFYVMLRTI